MTDPIRVRSHVGRGFLQNAAYFNTVPKIVWEYVSNAVDNPGRGDSVTVEVSITAQRIKVVDDGAGMDRGDLKRFFEMHGENLQRKQGKRVRGRFGTGKCAAFGLAGLLRIETVKGGLLNVVELSRLDVERSTGGDIPVRHITVDATTAGGDGTIVIVSDLKTGQLETPAVIRYVERHLGRQRQNHTVVVNDHLCELQEPVAVKSRQFEPPLAIAMLNASPAQVRVSAIPLDEDSAGIDVLSYGNWHDTTLAGVPVTDLSRRIFGEVEVPALEDYEGPNPPFDNTRNNTLRPQNPLVATLFGWLGQCIREVLAELHAEETERRRSAEAKALRAEADKITKLLNDDFWALQMNLARARKSVFRLEEGSDTVGSGRRNSDSPHLLPDAEGTSEIAQIAAGIEPGTGGHRRETPAGVGELDRPGSGLLPGIGPGSPREVIERKRRSEVFHLEFLHETESAHRSRYDENSRTIVINLDHPQVIAASRLGGRESPGFLQVCYELAFVEYAMALGYENVRRDEYFSGEDALYSIRDTINRITRRLNEVFGNPERAPSPAV